jgi:hypothetical protein
MNTEKLLSKWLIHKSNCPYVSPVQFFPNGFDAEEKPLFQIVIDYYVLNKKMAKDQFLQPCPHNLMAKLQGMKWFSKFDFFF